MTVRPIALGLLLLVVGSGCEEPEPTAPPWQGIVEYDERVLAFEVAGRVAAVDVTEGEEVAAAAPLARLDDTLETLVRDARAAEAKSVAAELELLEAGSRPEDIQSVKASLKAAYANVELAQQTLTRERRLTEQGIGVTAALDEARNALTTASARQKELQATLRRLRQGARDQEIAGAAARLEAAEAAVALGNARIERHALHTEIPGVVLDVLVEPDEVVQAAAPVVTLGDVTHPYVDVFVPQGELGELALGDTLEVVVDATTMPFSGTVEHIGRRTEFTPRFLFSERERPNLVVRVRVRVEAPQGDLPAGVPAFVHPPSSSPSAHAAGEDPEANG